MRHFLASLLLLAAPAMAADMVAKEGNDRVRLTQEPCPVSVLTVIPQVERGYFHRAYAQLNGHQWEACWAIRRDESVLMVYSDGDKGVIPLTDFRQDDGV